VLVERKLETPPRRRRAAASGAVLQSGS